VYIHALVARRERKKMSKTKATLLDSHRSDRGVRHRRYALHSGGDGGSGTDIAFNSDRTQGYRAFANKIWNAARFMFMNVDKAQQAGIWSSTISGNR